MELKDIFKILPAVKNIEITEWDKPVQNIFCEYEKLKNKDYCSVLLRSDYSLLAYNPFVVAEINGNNIKLLSAQGFNETQVLSFESDPWDFIKQFTSFYKQAESGFKHDSYAGIISAFGYELFDADIGIKRRRNSYIDNTFPDGIFIIYEDYLVLKGSDAVHIKIHLDKSKQKSNISNINEELCKAQAGDQSNLFGVTVFQIKACSNFSKESFMGAVNEVKRYIKEGDIYQANIAQRFLVSSNKEPFDLFKSFHKNSSTNFSTFINAKNFYIISCSPERFLKREKNVLLTEPIKGTSPRSVCRIEDDKSYNSLITNTKEEAELAMIVDLARNDLGISAEPCTVKVEQLKQVEKYPNVFHLKAKITAQAGEHIHSIDIIRQAFPPASVTGCPKIRAVEIINELEPNDRGFYCGCIGIINFSQDFDLSVAIRTCVAVPDKKGSKIFFSAGSGIVWDSSAEKEYEETLHKSKPLFESLK
ncbi:anthranilate synthase component I family protein [bacterium]